MSGPILLFGAAGQVGCELTDLARSRGVALVGLARAQADIADAESVARAIDLHQPRLIVNAAAWTAVDKAEANPAGAERGNVEGPRTLARVAQAAGVPLVHISTDYVFDGTKPDAYREDDPIAPLGVYGATKAAGEAAVRALAPRHVILRTSWVYGVYGANMLKTVLRLAASHPQLRFVSDQRGCPTSTRDIAEALLAVDRLIVAGGAPWGVFHFAGQGVTTWHGFAEEVVARQAAFTGKTPPVLPIATSDFPTPARRPANSELDSALFARTFGYRAAPWRERVAEAVATLLA